MKTQRRKIGVRLGMAGYATILRRLQCSALTTAQLCEAEIGCMNTTRQVLRRMHQCRLIHVAAWQPRKARCGGFASVWGAGDLPDAPYPGPAPKRQAKGENNVAPAMVAFASLIRELAEPCTKADLVAATGLNEETIRTVLDHAHRIHLVRIKGYQRHGHDGYWAALWILGTGPDARRPATKPRVEVDRDNRMRRKELAAVKRLQGVFASPQFVQAVAA